MYQIKVSVPHFQMSCRLPNRSLMKICLYIFFSCSAGKSSFLLSHRMLVSQTPFPGHAACAPWLVDVDKNTDALLIRSPVLCTETSHNIVNPERSLLTGPWLQVVDQSQSHRNIIAVKKMRLLYPFWCCLCRPTGLGFIYLIVVFFLFAWPKSTDVDTHERLFYLLFVCLLRPCLKNRI